MCKWGRFNGLYSQGVQGYGKYSTKYEFYRHKYFMKISPTSIEATADDSPSLAPLLIKATEF